MEILELHVGDLELRVILFLTWPDPEMNMTPTYNILNIRLGSRWRRRVMRKPSLHIHKQN
jgi:hypothetical protein